MDLLNINHRKIKIKHQMGYFCQQNYFLSIYFSFSIFSFSLFVGSTQIMIFSLYQNLYHLFTLTYLFLGIHSLFHFLFIQNLLIMVQFRLVLAYQLFNSLFKFTLLDFSISSLGLGNLEVMLLLQFFQGDHFQQHIQLSFFIRLSYIAFIFDNLFGRYKFDEILFLDSLSILDHMILYCHDIFNCISSQFFQFIWVNFLTHFYLSKQISKVCLFGTTLFQYIWRQFMSLQEHSSLCLKNQFFQIINFGSEFNLLQLGDQEIQPSKAKLQSQYVLPVFRGFMQFQSYYQIFGFLQAAMDWRQFSVKVAHHKFYFCQQPFSNVPNQKIYDLHHYHHSCRSNLHLMDNLLMDFICSLLIIYN